ncbi:hypothetical protein GUJ93_ZPchr0007g3265 [Zizania palustris]|uniref:Uncharacterized protein n=1 Tax=Zizania palustris TaxID=103762 RepID=A0A8J5SRP7_ZIZPA|nr:hypothetical protein GUJ93_ZPchr0007g3265 [Zizania palustris]
MDVLAESGRSTPSPAASPEFEFWMVGKNTSTFPSPVLLTADELFSDGIVLPLRTLQQVVPPPDGDGDGDGEGEDEAAVESSALPEERVVEAAQRLLAECGPAPTPDLPAVTFKWKDIFKATGGGESKDRKKMERRVSSVGGNSELININIWPFSRSRSAGGGGSLGRNKSNLNANANVNASNAPAASASAQAAPAPAPAGRKVSSAPCSRSNSRGESSGAATAAAPNIAAAACAAAAAPEPAGPLHGTSMLRRLVPGQGRTGLTVTGIRLGRASPVWLQLRRNKLQQKAAAEQKQQNSNATITTAEKKPAPVSAVAAVNSTQDVDGKEKAAPSVSTPATTGCRKNAACSEAGDEEVNPPQGLFGLRTFFSKKVH